MRDNQLINWINRCREIVDREGLYECDNYRDELIFCMEEGAERELTIDEIEMVDISLENRPSEIA